VELVVLAVLVVEAVAEVEVVVVEVLVVEAVA
jgi:hypothetical protein